jgi:hypothetical protein
MQEFLSETEYLDFNNGRIKSTVNDLIKSASDNKEKAILIHDFVRDNILFGWTKKFYDMKASQVLETKIGFCNNKSILFVAMLRAAQIPARLVYVDISKRILDGIVDPRSDYVDHSYSEVYLADKWVKVDSYIVDSLLFNNAKKKLLKEGKELGFGVHRDGTNKWDGEHDAFSQFVYSDSKNISTKEYGVFSDVKEFYEKTPNAWNKPNVVQSLVFFFLSGVFSKNADKIRKEIIV